MRVQQRLLDLIGNGRRALRNSAHKATGRLAHLENGATNATARDAIRSAGVHRLGNGSGNLKRDKSRKRGGLATAAEQTSDRAEGPEDSTTQQPTATESVSQ